MNKVDLEDIGVLVELPKNMDNFTIYERVMTEDAILQRLAMISNYVKRADIIDQLLQLPERLDYIIENNITTTEEMGDILDLSFREFKFLQKGTAKIKKIKQKRTRVKREEKLLDDKLFEVK